jgi:O-antigen/teichoic acid export membrane protein
MIITKTDVLWNYAATFLKIASSALLLPFILRMMPPETIGIWAVFMTITTFASLLDFGFNPSFTRNITYIFSGVKNLKIKGFETVEKDEISVDYGLLKGVISAMQWFYSRMAVVLLFILSTFGTYYINSLLKNYNGEQSEVYIAWFLLCVISAYNLYTLYYDALLLGKGLIKRSKQIVIIGQTFYFVFAAILILAGYGLIAIVLSQAISVIVIRWLSYRSFFSKTIKQKIQSSIPRLKKEVLKTISPNAIKIGLTFLGGFMVQRSAIIIGSLYLSLRDIASYGITMQLISVIAGLAGIYTATYQPRIVHLRTSQNIPEIKQLYMKGQVVLLLTYIAGGLCLFILGGWALNFIGSQTKILAGFLLFLALLTSLLETNLSIAATILVSKNDVPFFKASIISGIVIVIGMLLFFKFTNGGLLIMIGIPLIIDIAYQAWKWPLDVMRDLKIGPNFL